MSYLYLADTMSWLSSKLSLMQQWKNSRRLVFSAFVLLIIICLTFVFKISNWPSRKSSTADWTENIENRYHYLIEQKRILVPLHIKELLRYRILCYDQDGILNRTDLIRQIQSVCHANLNGTLTVDWHPPADFEFHALSSVKRPKTHLSNPSNINSDLSTTEKCPLFQNESVAIVIPYRDREQNLKYLIHNLVPLLKRQKISQYKIFVVEQKAQGEFNKGRLYNIAFQQIMKIYKPTCIIFHDVDLIPTNDHNLYSCLSSFDQPIHFSVNIHSKVNNSHTKFYTFLVGGVLAIRPKVFVKINGFSNRYFNWGGEDDDIGLRLVAKNICICRPDTGYYYATTHSPQTPNKNMMNLLFDAVLRQDFDGLSDISKLAI
ncbi:hypothetical protein I4U23_021935, partial [Adineta vaga]